MDNLIIGVGGGAVPPGFQAVKKTSEDEKQLYILPQPMLAVVRKVPKAVKTTVANDYPVMVTKTVPMLDAQGAPKTYQLTRTAEDEAGNIVQVGTGEFLPITIVADVQEVDNKGKKLYWATTEADEPGFEHQPPREITSEDPDYVEGLVPAFKLVPIEVTSEAPPKSAEQKIFDVEKSVNLNGQKVDSTSSDLQGFMDFYFSKNP